jgi:hypothetical protein
MTETRHVALEGRGRTTRTDPRGAQGNQGGDAQTEQYLRGFEELKGLDSGQRIVASLDALDRTLSSESGTLAKAIRDVAQSVSDLGASLRRRY